MARLPDHDRQRSFWQVAFVLISVALLALLFIGLGVWQIERLAWKRDLIDRVQTHLAAEPVPLDTVFDLAPEDQEYRRVQVSGVFDHTAETFTKAVTELGGGYWVITPLRVDGGQTVLINRGFVPPDRRDKTTRQDGLIDGPVTVTGLVRLSEPDGGFLRDNDPQADLWYSRDVAAIARARALGPTARIFVDAEASVAAPIGGLTVVKFRNTHLIYAVTWFALAVLVAFGMAFVIHHERQLR
ncbi:SURF1 family protein [Sedimentitalea sp.]|uniref:SURF1 family protein n=1 Tax=Sedimentitalea sp. TaxID=2048915 RepID=UPI003297B2E6